MLMLMFMSQTSMRFEVIMTVSMKITVFLDVTGFTLLDKCPYI